MPDFGTDMSGTTDLTPTLLDVSGFTLMREVICRRLYTPLGSLISAPDEVTCDLRTFIGSTQSRGESELTAMKGTATSALLADPRIFKANLNVTWEPDAGLITMRVTGEGADGPFALTLAITAVTIQVLE